MANFFGSVTAFIDKYLMIGLGLLSVALGLAFGVTQYRLASVKADLQSSQAQIEQLSDQLKVKEVELALKEVVISNLETRNAERLAEQQTYQFDLEGILNAPAEENQNAVDDVLCRAVSGTKCLRNN